MQIYGRQDGVFPSIIVNIFKYMGKIGTPIRPEYHNLGTISDPSASVHQQTCSCEDSQDGFSPGNSV